MTTLDHLRALVAALPPDASVTVPRAWVAELLDAAPAPAPTRAPPLYLTAAEVAKRLGCSPRHVYRSASTWPFTVRVAPKVLRFSEAGLERWLARRRAG
jgi:predicted DNA-binding transcriptional regulator AlpA